MNNSVHTFDRKDTKFYFKTFYFSLEFSVIHAFLFQFNLFVLHDHDVSFSLDLFNDAAHCFKISGKQNREANVMHI